MISDQILKKYAASVVPLSKGEVLFQEGDHARSFYIVRTGKIRMVNYNEEGREFVQTLCTRLIYKSTMLSELAIEEAEHRIVTFLRHLATSVGTDVHRTVRLPFTRKQIADMTGLRVETVIRTVKSLEQKEELSIDPEGKILWKR